MAHYILPNILLHVPYFFQVWNKIHKSAEYKVQTVIVILTHLLSVFDWKGHDLLDFHFTLHACWDQYCTAENKCFFSNWLRKTRVSYEFNVLNSFWEHCLQHKDRQKKLIRRHVSSAATTVVAMCLLNWAHKFSVWIYWYLSVITLTVVLYRHATVIMRFIVE